MMNKLLLKVCIVFTIGLKISGASVTWCNELTPEEKEQCKFESIQTSTDDNKEVEWIQRCVVKYFCLQPQPGLPNKFLKPQFSEDLKKPGLFAYFENAALRIESFFLRNSDWKATKSNEVFRAGDCSKLLAITDARYLYVTYVLFIQSERKLVACSETSDNKIKLPTAVCFLRPYGSASCTSDYDVGLVGHTSGLLTVKFNIHFDTIFKKPSEEVFDTNVYAYTLEYSMPELFSGMTGYFMRVVPYLDLKPWYQMQELASAYFKMFKYNGEFYTDLKEYAMKNLGGLGVMKTVPNRNLFFGKSSKTLEALDRETSVKNIENLRSLHNEVYNKRVMNAGKRFDKRFYRQIAGYMSEMAVALVYAAEAYHTRGAIRHVVGGLQMKKTVVIQSTTVMDYWVSMIENWADANKEYNHCTVPPLPVEECLLKMSKYLFRTFDAMKNIHKSLTTRIATYNALKAAFPKRIPAYPSGPKGFDLVKTAENWVKFRSTSITIPNFLKNVKPLLDSVGCIGQMENMPLSFDCMRMIQKVVMSYNDLLVSTTANANTQDVLIIMRNGEPKKEPFP